MVSAHVPVDPAALSAAPDRPPEPGDVLDGRFRLVTLLGRGGFGDVWRADELLPDGAPFRQVALKLLTLHVTDAASWVEEAKLLASFRHPSLVTIFATGVFMGRGWPQPFVSMELLEGETLGDVLTARGPVAWRRALAWAREAAAALDVIHERGVVHLDLKPANLFLCKDGTIKVLDFGIARRSSAPAQKRKEGAPAPAPALSARGEKPPTIQVKVTPTQRSPLSAREAELPTAAFMVEQSISDMPTAAFVAEQAAEAMDAVISQQSTPEAFAPTFAMEAPPNAHARTRHAGGTTARAIIGTPGYMAPEIFEQSEPSAATDAYALGVCVAVLTTGKLPLDVPEEPEGGWTNPTAITAWWAAIRAATLRGDLRDLGAASGLPPGLTALLRRLFSVDPAARGVVPGKLCALLDEVWERPFGVADPPYPGAASLGSGHEGLLFGREEEVSRLGRDLEHEPCVVLVGPPAVGKTSLARAGLVPHLGKRGIDGKDDFRAVVLREPGRGDEALDEALAGVSEELSGAGVEQIVAFCERSRVGLAIVVDPLEEVLAAGVEVRARLGELLALTGDGRACPGLRVVAVLGEEHTAALQGAAFGQALRASMRYVGPPAPQAAGAIVTGPARLAGVELSGLEPVVADVRRELAAPGRLPFVARALAELWAARERAPGAPDRVVLRGERWRDLRGVVGAIGRAADRALDAMSEADRALAAEMLLFFTATNGSRVAWEEDELMEAFAGGPEPEAARRVAGALEGCGALRRRGSALELSHEGLVEGWRRLQALRAEHLVRLAFVERLRESAHAWEKSAKSAEMLLRGQLLTETISKAHWMKHGLVERERELVRASVRAHRRRRALRTGGLAAGALAIVALFFVQAALERRKAAADRAAAEARHNAYVFDLVARSRKTEDPFSRVLFMAQAMKEGSTDSLLPVELAAAVADLPRAEFLTLEPVVAPSFPWDDRWIIAGQTSTTLLVVDLRPPDPEVIEDMDLDVDPDKVKRKTFSRPRVRALRPHDDPIAERAPLEFGTSFVTRSVTGEVRVFRLSEKGDVELAAIAPMKCAGPVRAAAAAPVIACATETGLAAWDLRKEGAAAVERHPWNGAVADVAPDGSVVAAIAERSLFLWRPGGGMTLEIGHNETLLFAKISPRDRVVASVTTSALQIHDLDQPVEALLRYEHRFAASAARWDEGGLNFGLCDPDRQPFWVYLRRGARPKGEAAPSSSPCLPAPGKKMPTIITDPADLGDFRDLRLGSRPAFGGFKLPDGRVVTRELLVFNQPKRAARPLLRFRGLGPSGLEEPAQPNFAVVNVVRDGGIVAWQVGGDILVYDAVTGERKLSVKGNLLRRCEGGRLASWSRAPAGYRVFDARTDGTIGEVKSEPSMVLGVDEACTTLFTQSLDGALWARPLDGGEARSIGVADGYVYDVRPSARTAGEGPGLYLLVSSGAVVRVDEAAKRVRLLAYATPRATSVADGPLPGEVLFADATGVLRLRADGLVDRMSEADAESTVTDVASAPDGKSVLFLAGQRLNVVDLGTGLRRAMNVRHHERMLRWDEEGSILLWSSDRGGPAEGAIVPRAKGLAMKVAEATSNLQIAPNKDAPELMIKP